MHPWSPSKPLLRTMGTAWERRQQTMSQAMHGARTVMTYNAFMRTISVMIMLFSLRIYNWTMYNDCTYCRVPLIVMQKPSVSLECLLARSLCIVVSGLCCSNSWICAFVITIFVQAKQRCVFVKRLSLLDQIMHPQ